MVVQAVSLNNNFYIPKYSKPVLQNQKLQTKNNAVSFGTMAAGMAAINQAAINMDRKNNHTPAQNLFYALTGRYDIHEDEWTKEHYFNDGKTGWKKWVDAHPSELLNRDASQAIQSICTLTKTDGYPKIKESNPDYGDNWGRHANYIEINPRTIAMHKDNRVSEGLLGVIKLLPAIPPSPDSFANCIVLSQLYPNMMGEGYTHDGEASLYTMNLNEGISKNLTSEALYRDGFKVSDEDLVKAFNELAHQRGLKTGFRMLVSADQMWVNGQGFNWMLHQEDFIDACCKGIELGFDSIYFDSAKHIGDWDMGNYMGVGEVPDYEQMQYITNEIRTRTGRPDLSFVGEKCDTNPRYEKMGFTAGTDYGYPENKQEIKNITNAQKWNNHYAAGPEVSNDNDEGQYSYEQRLERLDSCLFGYDNPQDKLPTFMQMHDIFPLSPYTNTHNEMLESINRSGDGTVESHNYNVFNTEESANWYRQEVYHKFKESMYI